MYQHAKTLFFMMIVSFSISFMAACPAPDWPKCENDDHCKKKKDETVDFVCVFGQCQECGRDTDCKDGKKCSRNICITTCSSDQDCAMGEVCSTNSICEKASNTTLGLGSVREGEPCNKTAECQSDLSCYNSKCLTDESINALKAAGSSSAAAANMSDDRICENESLIYFEYNAYTLTQASREALANVVACLESHSSWSLKIEGHADERGTTQYNLDLGDKRARSVKSYLKNMGVTSRIKTISYGEEQPLLDTATESAWAKNRRAVLRLIK